MEVKRSDLKTKKFRVGNINFGAQGYGDYDLYKRTGDKAKAKNARATYIASHTKIMLDDGTPAYKSRDSPEYYSMRALWNHPKDNELFRQVKNIRDTRLNAYEDAFIKKYKDNVYNKKKND